MAAGAILALKPPEQSQLTGQEQQQLPQALLVQLQGLTVIPAFLLLQEAPGAGCGWGDPAAPSPLQQVCSFPFPPGVRGPPRPPLTLAMAAEATSSAAQSRGLSLAISARGHGYGDCPKPSPFSPKPLPLPAPTPRDAQKSLPLRSSLAGFPFSRRFLLLEVTNTFSSSAREMYCLTCAHFGVRRPPIWGAEDAGAALTTPPKDFGSPWPGWLLCAAHRFHLRGKTTKHRGGWAENCPALRCCPPKNTPRPHITPGGDSQCSAGTKYSRALR